MQPNWHSLHPLQAGDGNLGAAVPLLLTASPHSPPLPLCCSRKKRFPHMGEALQHKRECVKRYSAGRRAERAASAGRAVRGSG